ncbi:MAG: hypothetical protein Q8P31_00465 [Bacillota bacterium]|nr:hypothetical protein [Bacillota bacterium]
MSTTQIWIAALGTLALFSFLWKENPAYRFVEHIFIGLTAAHVVVMNYDSYIKPVWRDSVMRDGKYVLIIPFLIGLLIYTRYSKSINWLARIPMSLLVGYGVGYTLAFNPLPFLRQVTDNFVKFQGKTATITANNVLFFVMSMAGLAYFFFTVSREKYGLQYISTLGRYTIVIALGASYGSTVQGRISLLLGRMQFLLKDWLGVLQ